MARRRHRPTLKRGSRAWRLDVSRDERHSASSGHTVRRRRKTADARPLRNGPQRAGTFNVLLYPCGPRKRTAERTGPKSISTNGANRPTQRPRVRNVWRCHWLSKRRANTKQIKSQTWARLDVSGGGPLLWPASIRTDALHRISMTARSSRNCLQATGHAFHWLSWSEQGTRGWPNDSGRLQTDLFGVALPFKLQKKGDPARRPRDALRD